MVAYLSAFSLGNLLAHGSAAYNPTLVQRTQSELRSCIEGSIARSFFPVVECVAQEVACRGDLRAHAFGLDRERVVHRADMLAVRSASWAKQVAVDAVKPKKAPHMTKRTVYTQAESKKATSRKSRATRSEHAGSGSTA